MSMEAPYTGLTALVKINSMTIGYINGVELNLEKEIVEVSQFGSSYKRKIPAIKNWSASAEGTVAFASGGAQHKLYQAFESGEAVTLTTKLDETVYFEGDALVKSLSISGSPEDKMSISVEFEGDGGLEFILPETVQVVIRSGAGGTTSPAGVIRATKGATLTVTCTPASGKKAATYSLNGGAAQNIVANTFTTTALNADENTIDVTWADV
jgi:predicted secreted protein